MPDKLATCDTTKRKQLQFHQYKKYMYRGLFNFYNWRKIPENSWPNWP